jgi:hypothetical protein
MLRGANVGIAVIVTQFHIKIKSPGSVITAGAFAMRPIRTLAGLAILKHREATIAPRSMAHKASKLQ